MLHIRYVNVTHRKDPKEETWRHSLGGLEVVATTPTVAGRGSGHGLRQTMHVAD
jgi:hypothetical protein